MIALANNLIGTKFHLALGYNGNHIDLSMERGEVHGRTEGCKHLVTWDAADLFHRLAVPFLRS